MSFQQLIQALYPYRVGRVVASDAALAAVPAEELVDCTQWIVDDNAGTLKVYLYKLGTAPPLQAGAVTATAGGYFVQIAVAAQPASTRVHLATAAALAANTRVGNVLTENGAGAALAMDGHNAVVGDITLVKDEAAGQNNGLYTVNNIGGGGAHFQLTRTQGFDTSEEMVPGLLVSVERGAVNDNTYWTLTTDGPITLNTTPLVFAAIPIALGATGAMTAETPDVAANAGAGPLAAPIQHVHAIACAVPAEVNSGTAALAESAGANFARDVHVHTFNQASGTLGARPAAALAGRTYHQSDTDPGLYRDNGATWDKMASRVDYREVTITSDDLTTAGAGPETENIGAALPAGAIPLGYYCNLTDAFDNGAGVSLTLEVGVNGDVDALEDGFDCFTGSIYEGDGPMFAVRGPWTGTPPLHGSNRQLIATFTAGADQLVNFTNGSITIRAYFLAP